MPSQPLDLLVVLYADLDLFRAGALSRGFRTRSPRAGLSSPDVDSVPASFSVSSRRRGYLVEPRLSMIFSIRMARGA